jgi:hypothetical protein
LPNSRQSPLLIQTSRECLEMHSLDPVFSEFSQHLYCVSRHFQLVVLTPVRDKVWIKTPLTTCHLPASPSPPPPPGPPRPADVYPPRNGDGIESPRARTIHRQ